MAHRLQRYHFTSLPFKQKIKIASLHAPMAGAFNDGVNNIYIQSLRNSLIGKKILIKFYRILSIVQALQKANW